jgi:hypothetical protein
MTTTRNFIVMFGGIVAAGQTNELWLYDITLISWTLVRQRAKSSIFATYRDCQSFVVFRTKYENSGWNFCDTCLFPDTRVFSTISIRLFGFCHYLSPDNRYKTG